MGVVFGGLADASMSALKFAAALTTMVLRWSWEPAKMAPALDPLGKVMSFASAGVFQALFGIAVAVCGLVLLWRAPRSQVRQTATHAAAAFAVTALVALSLAWAATGGPMLDRALTTVIALAGDAATGVTPDTIGTDSSAGDRLAAAIDTSVVYQTWLAGTFGRTDSPVVDRHAPDLYRASALTRAEAADIARHPNLARKTIEAKQDAFRAAAAKVKDEDPTAYEYLAGHQNLDRLGYTILGWLALLAVAPFALLGGVLMLVAVVAARLALWAIPLVAITAVVPGWHGPLRRLVETVIGMIGNAVIFGSLALIWANSVGMVLSPSTGAPAVVSVLVLMVAEWVLMFWCLHQVKKIAHPWTRVRPRRGRSGSHHQPRPARGLAADAVRAATTGAAAGAGATVVRHAISSRLRSNPYTGPSRMATTPPSFADSTDLTVRPRPGMPQPKDVRVTVTTSDLPPRPSGPLGPVTAAVAPAAIGPGRSVLGTDPDPEVYRGRTTTSETLTATPDEAGAWEVYQGEGDKS